MKLNTTLFKLELASLKMEYKTEVLKEIKARDSKREKNGKVTQGGFAVPNVPKIETLPGWGGGA